ncbi:alpha/beta fold hydrolase [Acidicapsa dinghuensis]|uniref:Alpha/beta fold hydrolase n=1 Tax=Acidicapsa dinghuensis TaxID=2218256 RepID=A0ABW1EAP4_9BACT|nr:alpha/beta hydrolase [Acidicapsa dinghuensis]
MRFSSHGCGEAVLLIHGMPTNGHLWDDVVRLLSRSYQCFAVDLPGKHGTPFVPYGPSYFKEVADQIEQVRIRSRVECWHVVGHDGGAAIAVQYAHYYPQRVRCLSLLSPAVFSDLRPPFPLSLLRIPILGEILAPLVHILFWQIIMRRAMPNACTAAQRESFQSEFVGLSAPWQFMQLVRWGKPEMVFKDFPQILRNLTCPTLLIHGSRDVLPASFARRASEMIPHSKLAMFDSGHFIPLEQSDKVAATLDELFRLRAARNDVATLVHV